MAPTEDVDEFVCPIEYSEVAIKAFCTQDHEFRVCGDIQLVKPLANDLGLEFLEVLDRRESLMKMTFAEAALLALENDDPLCDPPEPVELPNEKALPCENRSINFNTEPDAAIPEWLINGELGVSAETMSTSLLDFNRHACSVGGTKVACEVLRKIAGFDSGMRFETSHVEHTGIITQPSVFALLPAEQIDAETIILSAHLDSAYGSPGREDNLSGVILLLTLMRTIIERDMYFPWNLQFAFYAGEESARVGSRLHRLQVETDGNLASIRAVLNFDMIARNDHSDGWIYLAVPGEEQYQWQSIDIASEIEPHMGQKLTVMPLKPAPKSDNASWQAACRPVAAFRKLENLSIAKGDWYHLPKDTETEYGEIELLAAAILITLLEWS